jgi:hypothetical protein
VGKAQGFPLWTLGPLAIDECTLLLHEYGEQEKNTQ